jgi:hypothetical protein
LLAVLGAELNIVPQGQAGDLDALRLERAKLATAKTEQ